MGCGTTAVRKETTIQKKLESFTEFFTELAEGRRLVLYRDFILDLADFEHTHPGGAKFFDQIIGNDIYRCMNGGFFENSVDFHAHTMQAFEKMQNLSVGRVPIPFNERIYFRYDTKSIEQLWKLYSRTTIAKNMVIVQLRRGGTKTAYLVQGAYKLSGCYFQVFF